MLHPHTHPHTHTHTPTHTPDVIMQLPLTVFRSGYTIYVFQYFVEEAAGTVFFSRSVWTCRDCRHDADLQWDWPENSEHRIGRVKKKKNRGKNPPDRIEKKKKPRERQTVVGCCQPFIFQHPWQLSSESNVHLFGKWARNSVAIPIPCNEQEPKSNTIAPLLVTFQSEKKRALY